MNSEYITKATTGANTAAQSYEESLSYLLDGLDEIKSADQNTADVRYQNLLTTIRQQLPEIQQEFETGAKAAYINKQKTEQELNADLSRLGVNTQGFGVTQRNQNEVAYGQNYNQLVMDKNKAVRGLANQEVNALGKLNEDLSTIDSDYAKNKLDTTKYIKESGREEFNKTYDRIYSDLQYEDTLDQRMIDNARADKQLKNSEKQVAIENAFRDKQYADALAQRKFENDLATKQYNLSVANSRKINIQTNTPKQPVKTDPKGSKLVNTNRSILLPSRNKKAQKEYDSMVESIMSSGVSVNTLNTYLEQMSKDKIYTASDVAAIKKQFGI